MLDHEGKLRYRGRIDDNVNDPTAVKTAYLRQAIAQIIKGETVNPLTTEADGCSIKWREK